MNEQSLLEYVESSKEAIINDCIKIINFPSVSHRIEDVTKCLKTFIAMAESYGFKTFMTPKEDLGVIEMGQGDETIGILVHVDVVDAGDTAKWKTNPFEGVYDGENIWGRGAEDDKGPAVIALYAMKALKDMNLPLKKKIQLIVGTQEEVNWTDMENYTQHYKLPDFGFTPDGSFPIENREKGYADILMTFTSEERSNSKMIIKSLVSGDSVNSIPSHAEAEIEMALKDEGEDFLQEAQKHHIHVKRKENGNYILSADGITTHSSRPEKGINAILLMNDFLCNYRIRPDHAQQAIQFIQYYLKDDFYGKKFGIYREDPYEYGEYMDYTTIVPTMIRIQEKQTQLNLNARTRYGTTLSQLQESIDKVKGTFSFRTEVLGYLEPLYVNKDKKFIRIMSEVYEEISGQKNEFQLAYGTSYAKAMPNTVCFGPVYHNHEDFAHQENERISVDTLITAAKIYTLFLARTATLEEKCR